MKCVCYCFQAIKCAVLSAIGFSHCLMKFIVLFAFIFLTACGSPSSEQAATVRQKQSLVTQYRVQYSVSGSYYVPASIYGQKCLPNGYEGSFEDVPGGQWRIPTDEEAFLTWDEFGNYFVQAKVQGFPGFNRSFWVGCADTDQLPSGYWNSGMYDSGPVDSTQIDNLNASSASAWCYLMGFAGPTVSTSDASVVFRNGTVWSVYTHELSRLEQPRETWANCTSWPFAVPLAGQYTADAASPVVILPPGALCAPARVAGGMGAWESGETGGGYRIDSVANTLTVYPGGDVWPTVSVYCLGLQ
jgi:hypothetical protein